MISKSHFCINFRRSGHTHTSKKSLGYSSHIQMEKTDAKKKKRQTKKRKEKEKEKEKGPNWIYVI